MVSPRTHRPLIILAALLAAASLARAQGPAAGWWKHVVWLSDDSLKGRAVGSEGYRKAAEYVAGQFMSMGLAPGAAGGYLQPVGMRAVTIDTPASTVSIVSGRRRHALSLAAQVAVSGRGTCGATDAPLAFVGYGLSVPEVGHDDLAGQDLAGRVAVYFSGAPAKLTARRRLAGGRRPRR